MQFHVAFAQHLAFDFTNIMPSTILIVHGSVSPDLDLIPLHSHDNVVA